MEFNLMKDKFTKLSEFIRDVRFRVNVGQKIKRKDFYVMSRQLDFSKLSNEELDFVLESVYYVYNDSLRNKIKEINSRNISVNNNFIKRIKDAKNELNAKKVERNIILKKYGNKISEYENENNKLKIEIEIMQIKIKNIETELQIKNSCLDNIINNNGDYNKEQKYNNEIILMNKLVSDNKNLFNENKYLSDENKILKQKIEFLNDNLNNQIK